MLAKISTFFVRLKLMRSNPIEKFILELLGSPYLL